METPGSEVVQEAATAVEGAVKPPRAKRAAKAAVKPQKAKRAAKGGKAAVKPQKAKRAAKGGKSVSAAAGNGKGLGVLRTYGREYHRDKQVRTAGGYASVDSDDSVAKRLRGKTLDEVYEYAADIVRDDDGAPVAISALKKRYGSLNEGMQRMNLGNRIRAAGGRKRQ